jgi:NADPH:quinone reductase
MARKWEAVRFGGPQALELVDVDVPPPRSGEVVVDVRAVGMNPAYYKHIAGGQHPRLRQAHPPGVHVVRAISDISSAEITTAEPWPR